MIVVVMLGLVAGCFIAAAASFVLAGFGVPSPGWAIAVVATLALLAGQIVAWIYARREL